METSRPKVKTAVKTATPEEVVAELENKLKAKDAEVQLLKYNLNKAIEAGSRLERAYNDLCPRRELFCPWCGRQHVDKDEWATRPHHTHQCQHCFKLFDTVEWCTGVETFRTKYSDANDHRWVHRCILLGMLSRPPENRRFTGYAAQVAEEFGILLNPEKTHLTPTHVENELRLSLPLQEVYDPEYGVHGKLRITFAVGENEPYWEIFLAPLSDLGQEGERRGRLPGDGEWEPWTPGPVVFPQEVSVASAGDGEDGRE